MFKFGFSVFLVVCALQCMLVGSVPTAPKKDVEIVGEAIVEVAKALKEFTQSVSSSITSHATRVFSKAAVSLFVKAVVVVAAAEPNIFRSKNDGLGAEERKELYLVANPVIQLRERLDKMEKTDQILDKVSDEVAYEILTSNLNSKQGLKLLGERLDRCFREEPALREAYVSRREKVQRSYREVDDDAFPGFESVQDLPKEVMLKLIRSSINKLFLHHIYNRLTIYRKEYFTLARSMVEMAKDPKKLDKIQSIYDSALSEEALKYDPNRITISFEITADLFAKLREGFKKYPSLDADLQRLEKDVANRKDWDKGIWDLDIISV